MTAPTLPCAAPGCGLPPEHWIHYVGEGMAINGHFHRPTLSEPRPDDEGRETPRASTCAACGKIIGFREPFQFWELHDGRRYVHAECIRAAIEQARLTPHPAPLGATDEGLRQAARAVVNARSLTDVSEAIAALRAALRGDA